MSCFVSCKHSIVAVYFFLWGAFLFCMQLYASETRVIAPGQKYMIYRALHKDLILQYSTLQNALRLLNENLHHMHEHELLWRKEIKKHERHRDSVQKEIVAFTKRNAVFVFKYEALKYEARSV